MRVPELAKLAEQLDEQFHLVVWQKTDGFEVVAIVADEFADAFPLPVGLQAAAAESGFLLDTTTAARLEIEDMPADFWEDLNESDYGKNLKVSTLGLSGRKYLEVFHAVKSGENSERSVLAGLDLSEGDLLKVARWLREKSLFDHRSGDLIMKILTQLR